MPLDPYALLLGVAGEPVRGQEQAGRRLAGPILAVPSATNTPARWLKSIRFLDAVTALAPVATRRPSARLAVRRLASAVTDRERPWTCSPMSLP